MTPTETRVFIDAIEDELARLLYGEQAFTVPRALLPPDAKEGQWLLLVAAHTEAGPDRTSALRERLGRSDPGGDIKL